MSIFRNVLSPSDLEYINNLPEVISARNELDTSNHVYFFLSLNDTIRSTILERLGLNLSTVESIPMRWMKGDTAPHVDTGFSNFENTYLLYVNQGQGEFILDNTSYPITQNTAFVFNEGVSHETIHTGTEPRLLIGPMNEFAEPVGAAPGPICFKEDSKILCFKDGKEVEVKIQDLRSGVLVKTLDKGYLKVTVVSKSILKNPPGSNRISSKMYKCSKEKYPELTEDLYVTGGHAILVDTLTLEQQEKINKNFGRLPLTSNKYRLMACIDERAEPCLEGGDVTIYHFALENDEVYYNYGVYANGLLVETCNTKHILSRKDMILL